MISNISYALSWLKIHPNILKGIRRGIERETLRVTKNGKLAVTKHPKHLGSALTHYWITTDFAEALLEFITPVCDDFNYLFTVLRDIHRYVVRNLGSERMWPLSMPCFIGIDKNITLAQFGSSNIGRMKTLYRKGLKNRYGVFMQTISGVHYNFSLPLIFWQKWLGIKDLESGKVQISEGYFNLIRNYYRFGWVIPYLFGASPAMCSSFLKKNKTSLLFQYTKNGMCYLPYATSLRMSNFGYTNKLQENLGITFNDLYSYVSCLKRATTTPSKIFSKLNKKNNNNYLQLNNNILQIENELYELIRPKRITNIGETPTDALLRGGIEYVELRSLDVNPFSPIGIDEIQVRFLDLFLIWCTLVKAPKMSVSELLFVRKNWNRVTIKGRQPNQIIDIKCNGNYELLSKVGKELFYDLGKLAEVLDYEDNDHKYKKVFNKLILLFDNPDLTFSARILKDMIQNDPCIFGFKLAEKYHNILLKESLEVLSEIDFHKEKKDSWKRQRYIEDNDTLSFEDFIKNNMK